MKKIIFFCCLIFSASLSAITNQKLNHPLLPGQRITFTSVFTTPNRVVYAFNEQFDNVFVGIFSVDFWQGPNLCG